MPVKDIMSANVISVSSDDTISNALSKMKKYRLNQLPVIDDGLKGMLLLKKIVTTNIDPSTAKAGNFIVPATMIDANMPTEESARLLLNSGFRALPVTEKGKVIGMISETDLIKTLRISGSLDSMAVECECVSKDDDVGKVKKIMAYRNVSRVPVVDNEKIVGVVSTLDLIDLLLKGKSGKSGFHGQDKSLTDSGYKEIVSIDKIKAEMMMSKPVLVERGAPAKEIIKLLTENEEVFIQDSVPYILTPKDLLEAVARSAEKGVYVQVTNLHNEDSFTQAKIDSGTTRFVQKISSMMNIQSLIVHIERHEKQGKNIRYDIRARLLTPFGLKVSHSQGWDVVTAVQDALDNLETEITKKYSKVKSHEPQKKSKAMRR